MAEWYVAQVMTGSEVRMSQRLHRHTGLHTAVPTRIVPELTGGEWHTRERVIMPGYLFVHADMRPELYYAALRETDVIRFLGATGPEPLPPPDAALLELLINNGKPIADSSGFGPFIVRRESRRRRDVIDIELIGKHHTIELMQPERGAGDSSPVARTRT